LRIVARGVELGLKGFHHRQRQEVRRRILQCQANNRSPSFGTDQILGHFARATAHDARFPPKATFLCPTGARLWHAAVVRSDNQSLSFATGWASHPAQRGEYMPVTANIREDWRIAA